MKMIKIHIWFFLNLSIAILFIYNINLLQTPIWIVLLLSNLLLGNKKTFSKKFTNPISFRFILLLLVFGFFCLSKGLENINNFLINEPIIPYLVVSIYIIIISFGYFKQLSNKKNGSRP